MTKMSLSSAYFPFVFYKKYKDHPSWEVTARICKKIERQFAENNVPVDFVLIPTTYQVNPRVMEEYMNAFDINTDSVDMEQPNRILGELFMKDSMTLHDPLSFFRRKTEEGIALYGTIDAHFNENGHEATAEFLMPILSEHLLKMMQPDSLATN